MGISEYDCRESYGGHDGVENTTCATPFDLCLWGAPPEIRELGRARKKSFAANEAISSSKAAQSHW